MSRWREDFRLRAADAFVGNMTQNRLRIGLFTDVHYARMPPDGDRYYADSRAKLAAAVDWLNGQSLDLAVCLGDLIDSPPDGDAEMERGFLAEALAELSRLDCSLRFVLGNHDVWRLTKREFLTRVGQAASRFSLDLRGFHLTFLDACYRPDGAEYVPSAFSWDASEIPDDEREWLAADLASTDRPTIVFAHQRLDAPADDRYRVHSAAAVREILEASGKVRLVVQGHNHENDRSDIGGIPFVTLRAMVLGTAPENNAAAILTLDASVRTLRGFGQQASLVL
jgi:alkaline phosphatase